MPAELQDGPQAHGPREVGPGPILRRAIQREVAVPASIALAGLSVAVLTKSLLSYADWIVNRGLSLGEVGWIALHEIVPVVAQTLPFALLLGVLVAMGRLKADLELLGMESLGIARLQLVGPIVVVAMLGWAASGILTLWAAPASRHALEDRLDRMQRESPGALLKAGISSEFDDRQLLAREVSPDGTRLRGVLLWLPEEGEAVFAEEGELRGSGEDSVDLLLRDAVVLATPADGPGGQHVEVARFETRLDLHAAEPLPTDRLAAVSTLSLLRDVGSGSGEDDRRRDAELHRRFAQPTAALLLGVSAAPLALGRRRFSRSAGSATGLVLTAAYYGLVQFGQALMRDPAVPVAFAVWLAPLAIALLAVVLLVRLARFTFDEEPPRAVPATGGTAARPVGVRGVLDRYVLSVYAGSAALAMGALFVAYFLIDILERLDWFAKHSAHLGDIAVFYTARVPLLVSRVVPMALLAGSALTVSLLAVRNELVAMQACGIRLGRALLPVLAFSALLVPVDFWLNDRVVTRTNAWADRIKVERIKDRSTGSVTEAWYRSEGQLVRASRSGLSGGLVPDLVVYELGPHGLPVARIHAREARRVDDGTDASVWELIDAQALLISERGLEVVDAPRRYSLGAARRAEIDPMHLPARRLVEEIRAAQAGGFQVLPLQVEFHRKLSGPLACLLLPAIALLIAVRSRRPPSAARNLVACAALGVTYLLVGDVAASFGIGGQISPAAAGWAPPTMALFGAAALMLRPRA